METKFNFTKMTLAEFETWLQAIKVGRTILKVQQHHTYIPSYQHFTGSNHFQMQRSMQNVHVNSNGWSDIAQHFTIFPDGTIMTGRSLESTPAGIVGQNSNAICMEHIGFFDKNKDQMSAEKAASIIGVTALLCKKFNLPVNLQTIIYHHWYSSKSCPGTNFFGGNKRSDCEQHFLPLVRQAMQGSVKSSDESILKYAITTASSLNVRTGPGTNFPLADDRAPLAANSVIRVYNEQPNWYQISKNADHWVSSRFTQEVTRFKVKPAVLNVRSGPGTNFFIVDKLRKDEDVFISEFSGIWAKIGLEDRWVSKNFLEEF